MVYTDVNFKGTNYEKICVCALAFIFTLAVFHACVEPLTEELLMKNWP
jgi:hypothetical protein